MKQIKRLNKLLSVLDDVIDDSLMNLIDEIESEAKNVNDKICQKFFDGDKRYLKSFIKISKRLKNHATVELCEDNSISIYQEWRNGKYMDRNEICFRYVKEAEGCNCFQQTYSNIQDFDGHTPSFDETEELIDADRIIDLGECV